MNTDRKPRWGGLFGTFHEMFGLGPVVGCIVLLFVIAVVGAAMYWFVRSAPPKTMVITAGPEGSVFRATAEKYRAILARNGVTLEILDSGGSEENLGRLEDPAFRVDVGFVQGGVTNGPPDGALVSLGCISYAPLLVFYRGTATMELLSELAGKRVVIGPPGSGARALALTLLENNGIESNGPTTLLDLDAQAATKGLMAGDVDAVFLMGDSASPQLMRQLLRTPGIRLYNFVQADGYSRRITYLNKLEIPEGAIDFGKNIPSQDVALIGPTVDLVARKDLHPALSDLLLEAAGEVHGRPGLFQTRGEFPAPVEHAFRLSPDAVRYYKSGKSFFYRYFPFWLASLVDRIVVVIVPLILVLVPGVRLIPTAYRWRIRLLIYRWYRALLALEREPVADLTPEKREHFLKRLAHIEREVNRMRVPASFADQFYALRVNIDYVRGRLSAPS